MKKITDKELDEVKKIQNLNNELANKLGNIEFSRISLNIEYENLRNSVFEAKKKQADILRKLSDKYGDVIIDPNTGIISDMK